MVRADPASAEAPAAIDPGHEGAPAPSGPAQETVKVTQLPSPSLHLPRRRVFIAAAECRPRRRLSYPFAFRICRNTLGATLIKVQYLSTSWGALAALHRRAPRELWGSLMMREL